MDVMAKPQVNPLLCTSEAVRNTETRQSAAGLEAGFADSFTLRPDAPSSLTCLVYSEMGRCDVSGALCQSRSVPMGTPLCGPRSCAVPPPR